MNIGLNRFAKNITWAKIDSNFICSLRKKNSTSLYWDDNRVHSSVYSAIGKSVPRSSLMRVCFLLRSRSFVNFKKIVISKKWRKKNRIKIVKIILCILFNKKNIWNLEMQMCKCASSAKHFILLLFDSIFFYSRNIRKSFTWIFIRTHFPPFFLCTRFVIIYTIKNNLVLWGTGPKSVTLNKAITLNTVAQWSSLKYP